MTIKDLPTNHKAEFIREMMNEVCRWRTHVTSVSTKEYNSEINWYACYGIRRALEMLYGNMTKTFLCPFMSNFGEMTLQNNPGLCTDQELLNNLLKAFDLSLVEYEDYIHKETIIVKREEE